VNPESIVPYESWEKWIPGSALAGCPGMTANNYVKPAYRANMTARNFAASAVPATSAASVTPPIPR